MSSLPPPSSLPAPPFDGKYSFSIDRGGTFTDIYCILPHLKEEPSVSASASASASAPSTPPAHHTIVYKLLSCDPSNYDDAPTEGIRRILSLYDTPVSGLAYTRSDPINTSKIASIRMGTTVATNALLERKGAPNVLLVTSGFASLLQIGNQSRPDIFDLKIATLGVLYDEVIEVPERVRLVDEEYDAPESVRESVETITGERVLVINPLTPDLIDSLTSSLLACRARGIDSVSIVLLHSYIYPDHELQLQKLCESLSFSQITVSHATQQTVKIVNRGHTTTASSYLTPSITEYLKSFKSGFDTNLSNIPITFMKSDGGLTSINDFQGHQAILSGPAGGFIGYAKTSYRPDPLDSFAQPCIGFDMGGTSTDVSRYDGKLPHVFETTTAGITIATPTLDINTVAAGGGSRLFIQSGRLVVGPESAGSHPGPVSYRKEGGMLAVTDANVVLGRVLPDRFPNIFGPNENEPLDEISATSAFNELLLENRDVLPDDILEPEQLAYGFLQVANEAMCRPIRNLTQMRGYDITDHVLSCFGGAGPQHACAIAKKLGMSKVHVHKYGGVLSAYGLSLSDAVEEMSEPANEQYKKDGTDSDSHRSLRQSRFGTLASKCVKQLTAQGYDAASIKVEKFLNLRYEGTDTAVMTPCEADLPVQSFKEHYVREFGFDLDRDIFVDDYRVRCIVEGSSLPPLVAAPAIGNPPQGCVVGKQRSYFESGWVEVEVFDMDLLQPGHVVDGPAIIVQAISTVVIEESCIATITSEGCISIEVGASAPTKKEADAAEVEMNPIMLSIFGHRFMGIAESMGKTLQRTSVSVNIKERLDFSCALFGPDGGLVANAPHIPVHLGAMQSAVRFQQEYWAKNGGIQKGDVLVSNHPQLAGGSHLPDITVITPVFNAGSIEFFVASRGHHADIGGIAPGSMPPGSTSLVEEGAAIIACKLVEGGQFQEQRITDLLNAPGLLENNFGTRNLRDNLSDLRAQVAANNMGIRLVNELIDEYSLKIVQAYMGFIQTNAEVAVRHMLKEFAKNRGSGEAFAEDYMDDGTAIKLMIQIDEGTGDAVFDFTGTGPQVMGNTNAPPAVTYSAVIYCLRCLVGNDIPLNQGCLKPVSFVIEENTILNPSSDAAVVGGNVLTSQRLCDVILKAFGACAASQGCMNNLTFGNEKFGYYETIAGGHGAGDGWQGKSGVHTHMT
jgi:5-oxoprolinase (ATP-hydrolysing)